MEATLKRFVVISLLCKVCMSSRNCMNLYINLYLFGSALIGKSAIALLLNLKVELMCFCKKMFDVMSCKVKLTEIIDITGRAYIIISHALFYRI